MNVNIVKTIWNYLTFRNQSSLLSIIPTDTSRIYSYDDGSQVHIMATKDDNATETQVKLAEQSSVTNLSAKGAAYFGNGTDQYLYISDNANLRFGTGNFGFIFEDVNLPDYTSSAAVTIARKANTTDNLGWILTLETDGKPQLAFGNATNFTTLAYKSANAISASDGQRMHLGVSVTRETASVAGSVNFYEMNQNVWRLLSSVTITAGTPQTVTETNLSSLLLFQNINGTTEYIFNSLGGFLPLNHAPTMDEVKSYIEYGVPRKYKGASQTSKITGDDSDFDTDTGNWTDYVSYVFNGVVGDWSGGAGTGIGKYTVGQYGALRYNGVTTLGVMYRVSIKAKLLSGTSMNCSFGSQRGYTLPANNFFQFTPTGTETIFSGTFLASGTDVYISEADNSGASSGEVILIDDIVLTQIGCVAEYLPEGIGHYSWMDNSGNALHGTVSGALPFGLNIGDRRTAYLSTTSTTPTMTDVIKGGWKVVGFSFATAQNLTVIDATQETSSIKLIDGKTVNNGILICDAIADHLAYEPGTDKDIVFTLTGNGGAGTVIKVVLEKVK